MTTATREASAERENPVLMLVDGHALVHRAFHALPPLSTSTGETTNAVFGFSSMLLKAIEVVHPTQIIMAMDRPTPTFRHRSYADYKATRPSTPLPLVSQFKRVREVAEALNIPISELDGYEADDVLGTLSAQAEAEGVPAVIVTGDLDALQLVSDDVHVLTSKRGFADTVIYNPQAVRERYGFEPDRLPDFKGLVGDTSDNIPGVPGIGEKTASKLLVQYGTLEEVLAHLDELPEKTARLLREHGDQALRSKELATIVRDAPINLELRPWQVDRPRVVDLFATLEFHSLIDRLRQALPATEDEVMPERTRRPGKVEQLDMLDGLGIEQPTTAQGLAQGAGTEVEIVREEAKLRELVERLESQGVFAFDTETTSPDPMRAKLVGVSFATETGHAWYLPLGHLTGEQLRSEDALAQLKPLLEASSTRKIGHNLKYDKAILGRCGIDLAGIDFDTMLAAYLVNPTSRNLSLTALALARLRVEMTPIEELLGKGRKQLTMDEVPVDTVAPYAGADADISWRLHDLLHGDLEEREALDLFREVEMPLLDVLADMEQTGICLDSTVLEQMSGDLADTIGELEGSIYERVGHRFNISSNTQLGQVLFGELKLPSGRRTKTGYSTDNEVLERLREEHAIVADILEFRQLLKLKNTYLDALPGLVNPETRRVHTDFNQAVTATGRLSSSNPNLQNIPVRGDLGRRVRRAFVASGPDMSLLAADYSQIELRVLASMSDDPRLVESFRSGQDVHRTTAAAVFGVDVAEVTDDQRRIAKVVNFGIVYGIGEARLAFETGISRSEAAEFIANYNRTYAGVKAFMDGTKKKAAYYGYVETMLKRRRYIPDIHSDHPGIRQAAERAAINMPIQGTAADIIKLAMIRLHALLADQYPAAKMVLQVHDELVFDVPSRQLDEVARLVKRTMEEALELRVPVVADVKVGRDWYDIAPVKL